MAIPLFKKKMILRSFNLLFLWGFPASADYLKCIRKISGNSTMRYSIRVPDEIQRYSICYSKFSNVRTFLVVMSINSHVHRLLCL